MNLRRLTAALALSLVTSGGCTFLLARFLGAHASKAPEVSELVASTRALAIGDMVKASDLQMIQWPKSVPLPGAFNKSSELVGRAVFISLAQGQPILDSALTPPGSGAGLASRIPDGMRAIALRSDDVVGVGGFLNPGSHVDVLVTYRPDMRAEASTATALQDVMVLAAGQRIQPDPAGKPESVTVVTLLLLPEEAERAVLASTQGVVHFILRGATDRSTMQIAPILLSGLSGTSVEAGTSSAKTATHHPKVQSPEQQIETVLDGGSSTGTADAGGAK